MKLKTLAKKHAILTEALEEFNAMENELKSAKAENEKLKKMISKAGYAVKEVNEGVFELIKDDESEIPLGDYINPIIYEEGMAVEKGKFYSDYSDIWEAKKNGIPESFTDTKYFDIIA